MTDPRPSPPLSRRQEVALSGVGRGFVSHYTGKSLPSLIRRGLVHEERTRSTVNGRPQSVYTLTEAGRATVAEIRNRKGKA